MSLAIHKLVLHNAYVEPGGRMTAGDPFAGVVRQRSQLARAMQQVELAAAAPTARKSWIIDLQHSLRRLEIAVNNHIVEVQAPMGLLDRIVHQAPRLQRSVEQTKVDHAALAESIAELLATMDDTDSNERQDDIRDAALSILVALARHRQKGADLIYDAYAIDIGGY